MDDCLLQPLSFVFCQPYPRPSAPAHEIVADGSAELPTKIVSVGRPNQSGTIGSGRTLAVAPRKGPSACRAEGQGSALILYYSGVRRALVRGDPPPPVTSDPRSQSERRGRPLSRAGPRAARFEITGQRPPPFQPIFPKSSYLTSNHALRALPSPPYMSANSVVLQFWPRPLTEGSGPGVRRDLPLRGRVSGRCVLRSHPRNL
jgi:hypothetical protein